MKKLENFLNQGISNPDEFCKALNMAITELRCRDANTDIITLTSDGDLESIRELNASSVRPMKEVFSGSEDKSYIPVHAKRVVDNWEKNNTATLFRGTRLPDNSSSFELGGIHTTPQLDVASGYAGGLANSSTGIGRLLKKSEIGFVSAYEVPLNTTTYANFQFEDVRSGKKPDSTQSLNDLKESLQVIAQKDASEFYIDDNYMSSEALKSWERITSNTEHYEVILPETTPVTQMYVRTSRSLMKIDPENAQWDRLLARVQEASLRDFYEIKPLEKAQMDIKNGQSYFSEDADKMVLLNQVQALVETEKNQRLNAPWQAVSMKDVALSGSAYMDAHPNIAQSLCVGSAMETKSVYYDDRIEKLLELSEKAYLGKWDNVKSLMAELNNTPQNTMNISPSNNDDHKNKIQMNIAQMRNQFFKPENNEQGLKMN
jgi:hypothetical protein